VIARLVQPAWAPVAVVALSFVVGQTSFARDVWWLFHLAGGAALGFFFLRSIDLLRAVRPAMRYGVAFAFACTAALGWELAEFAFDQLFRMHLQEGLLDTMSDLMFAVCGAALYLAYVAFTESKA
jgi:hypothetical protein